MAATLRYFALPDDERALFRLLARHAVTVWPELVPPGCAPRPATPGLVDALDLPACYLAVERVGPVVFQPVKRGPDRGMLEIEEIPSAVLHDERSLPNEAGELVSGRIWGELDLAAERGSRRGKPIELRRIFEEIHALFRRSWRRSDPKGFWVGPRAAEAVRRGELRLREAGHRGRAVGVWR